jgi:hypothetical protein
MFAPEDYNVSMESDLKLRIMHDEIDSCLDVKKLQKYLKETSKLVMIYQQLLAVCAKEMIAKDMSDWASKIKKDN